MISKKLTTFTIIELLIVISILGILISLLSPSLRSVFESAKRTECSTQMKQIHMAHELYKTDHDEYIPVWNQNGSRSWNMWVNGIWPYAGLDPIEFEWNEFSHRRNTTKNLFHCPVTTVEVVPSTTWKPYSDTNRESSYAYNASSIWINLEDVHWQVKWKSAIQEAWLEKPSQSAMVMEHQHHVITSSKQYGVHAIEPHSNQFNAIYWDGHLESKFHFDIPTNFNKTYWSGK